MAHAQKAAFKCRVSQNDAGQALIDYISTRFRYHSEDAWLKNIKNKELKLNGQPARPEQVLNPGDQISYTTTWRSEPKVPKAVPIVLEDADLIIANKPAHLPVHPVGRYLNNTLLNILRSRRKTQNILLAHRLDRETSGLCVLSKSTLAKNKLYWTFYNGEVKKLYTALVWGIPPSTKGTVDVPIGKSHAKGKEPLSKVRIKQMPKGYESKSAKTKYRLIKTHWIEDSNIEPPPWVGIKRAKAQLDPRDSRQQAWPISVVECQLLTGRTNQIRVHMAELGCGVVGDKLYDPEDWVFDEITKQNPVVEGQKGAIGPKITQKLRSRLLLAAQALHARRLEFRHPRNGQMLKIQAAYPKEWRSIIRELD